MEQNKQQKINYVALPEQIYRDIMAFLSKQPFEIVENFIPLVKSSVRMVEEKAEDEQPKIEEKQEKKQ